MDKSESPYLILNWLQSGSEEMQLSALEQLCLSLLQYESNEALIKLYPPLTYVPILACLCQDFDISPTLLEAVIRTLTYYMQAVPHEVINRLVNTKGSLLSICMRLESPNMNNAIESDLTQQIIKLFEELCRRETKSLSSIGGCAYIINFMSKYNQMIHLDTIKSGFYVLYKIIDKIDPNDVRLSTWVDFLSKYLSNGDSKIVECCMHCLLSIIKVSNEKKVSTDGLGIEKIVDDLLDMTLSQITGDNHRDLDGSADNRNESSFGVNDKAHLSRVVIDLILCMIKGSTQFLYNLLVKNKLVEILQEIIWHYETASLSIIHLVEGMFDQITEHINFNITNSDVYTSGSIKSGVQFKMVHSRIYNEELLQQYWKYHASLARAIINGNLDVVKELLLSADFDSKYKDKFGQTILNWACATGFLDAVSLLTARGVDINAGDRATSIHYAIIYGHINVLDYFFKNHSIDVFIKDYNGKTIIDRLKEFIVNCDDQEKIQVSTNVLNKLENHIINLDEQILKAKEYYIRRITPILINVYLRSSKTGVKMRVLELILKILQSFQDHDYKVLLDEIYNDYPLVFHLTKLIYRVLAQDTGENTVEAIKICQRLLNYNSCSTQNRQWILKMGITDMLTLVNERFSSAVLNCDEAMSLEETKLIPLEYCDEQSQMVNQLTKRRENVLTPHQSYYWGDWNIIGTNDGLNIYNDYCLAFIPAELTTMTAAVASSSSSSNSKPPLHIKLLTTNDHHTANMLSNNCPTTTVAPDYTTRDCSKSEQQHSKLKSKLLNNFDKSNTAVVTPVMTTARTPKSSSQKLKHLLENSSNFYDMNLDRYCSKISEYAATTVYKRQVNVVDDLIPTLLEKYTILTLQIRPLSLSLPFPKLPPSQAIYYGNLEIAVISNHLKVSVISLPLLSAHTVERINNSEDKTTDKNELDTEYMEISFNSITGIHVKTSNQSIHKTGALNSKNKIKKLGYSPDMAEKIKRKLNKCSTLLKMFVCERIKEYSYSVMSLLNSAPPLTSAGASASASADNSDGLAELVGRINQFLDSTENSLTSVAQINDLLKQTFVNRLIKLTPIEVYESGLIGALQMYFKKLSPIQLVDVVECYPIITNMMLQLLEMIETLPSPYQKHNHIPSHYLTRPFQVKANFTICQEPTATSNIDPIPDLSKYPFQVMPLTYTSAIIKRLKNLLNKMPWYRANKHMFNSIRQLAQPPHYVRLLYDKNSNKSSGLFYWLGTDGFRANLQGNNRFMNPLRLDLVSVSVSENSCTGNSPSTLNNLFSPIRNLTSVESKSSYVSVVGPNSFLTIYLKHPLGLIPTHYTLVRPNVGQFESFCLVNWKLLASDNGIDWDVISTHENDTSLLKSKYGKYTWKINLTSNLIERIDGHGWNMFKIQTFSNPNIDCPIKDASTSLTCLPENRNQLPCNKQMAVGNGYWLTTIEFYGTVYAFSESKAKQIRQQQQEHLLKFQVGTKVIPGPDWYISALDYYSNGKIVSILRAGSVLVEWNRGNEENKCHIRHKMGPVSLLPGNVNCGESKFELALASPSSSSSTTSSLSSENVKFIKNKNTLKNVSKSVESQSSTDELDEEREKAKSSILESSSWIIDVGYSSIPLRTSSLSSLRNSKLSHPLTKENFVQLSNWEPVLKVNKQKTLEIESATVEEQNIPLQKVTLLKDTAHQDASGIVYSNKTPLHLRESEGSENESKFKNSKDDSKKNFNLTKQTAVRESYSNNECLNEGREAAITGTLADIIEYSDASDECDSIKQHSCKRKESSPTIGNDHQFHFVSGSDKKSNYESYCRPKRSKNYIPGLVESNKFKPIQIDHTFTGMVQTLNHRSENMNPSAIRSNIENINYKCGKDVQSMRKGNTKYFGYKPESFGIKLEIQKPNNSLSSFANHIQWENYLSLNGNTAPKKTYTHYFYKLNEYSETPIANFVIDLLPTSDSILNMFSVDYISETWNSYLTFHYGFCEQENECPHDTCIHQAVSKVPAAHTVTERPRYHHHHHHHVTSDRDSVQNLYPILNLLAELNNIRNHLLLLTTTTTNMDNKAIGESSDQHRIKSTLSKWTHDSFVSQYICKKTLVQLEDVWAVLNRNKMPSWVTEWPIKYAFLYSYDIRVDILWGYWFGASRSIVWLQRRPKGGIDHNHPTIREDNQIPYSYLGRLKKHVARVPRPYKLDTFMGFPAVVPSSTTTSAPSVAPSVVSSVDAAASAADGGGGGVRSGGVFTTASAASTSSTASSTDTTNNKTADQAPQTANIHFSRPTDFWNAAKLLLEYHAEHKEELEIQFEDEEGTGLGPTLEFMNILSLEFQRISTKMWIHTDKTAAAAAATATAVHDSDHTDSSFDHDEFVHVNNGLFPYPWPANEISDDILDRFHLLGILMAKCLLDSRRIDIPFSESFLKLLLAPNIPDYDEQKYLNEFINIYPERGAFLRQLVEFCSCKQQLIAEMAKSAPEKLIHLQEQLQMLAVKILGSTFDDLCIDMDFLPTTKCYGNEAYPLKDRYSWEEDDEINDSTTFDENYCDSCIKSLVTEYNAEKYVERTLMYSLSKGIKKQIDAVKDGFNQVFPIASLQMFTVREVAHLLCGERRIVWNSLDELYQYTEPTQGYTRDSPPYQMLLSVLFRMTQPERRGFIQFVTGCPSLPPGGLRALRPRLTIVKKATRDSGPYPSVNTCMHYLKLPEYSSELELKTKLLEACKQIGFYLN